MENIKINPYSNNDEKETNIESRDGCLYINGQNISLMFYPVGSIYTTDNKDFNPNISFGGEWKKIDEGYYLMNSCKECVGYYTSEGLPNITGGFQADQTQISSLGGAFYRSNNGTRYSHLGSTASNGNINFNFDARCSCTIYGNSNHVTPNTYNVYMWRRVN